MGNFACSAEKQGDITPPGPPPQAVALEIATGNWKAQATRAFITSNIAGNMEELCTGDNNFVSVEDIAKASDLNPQATYRLLRFLSTFDVCIESGDKRKKFKLGPVGKVLTPNNPQSVANMVVWEADFLPTRIWDRLDTFLKTNDKVLDHAIGAPDMWAHFASNSSDLGTFQKAMTGYSNEEAFFLFNGTLSPTFDLSTYKTVCDLGAAEGTLALMLAKRYPDCNYIISDLPEAVARLDTSTLPSNFSAEAANFLETVPKADAYLLKHIIHDWNDEKSEIILKNIYDVNPNATVFIMEFGPMPGANIPHLAKGFDLHMGIMVNASERTQEEYDALYEKSGCERVATHSLAGGGHPLYVQEIKRKA